MTDTDPRWVGMWFPGFLISAGMLFILSILFLTFPETLNKRTLTAKEKRRLRKQLKSISTVAGTLCSSHTNDSSRDILPPKRQLETIQEDEASEVIDQNFEFLDSISARVPNNVSYVPNFGSGSGSDTVSNFSTSVSSSTFRLSSHSPSLAGHSSSEASSMAIIVPKSKPAKRKRTCSAYFRDKFAHTKLKLKGFFKSFFKLILNLRYTLLIIILSIECILVAGFVHYMILYSQNIYQISSSRSSILVGGVIVPSAIIGAILGGIIVRKFDLGIEGCTRLIIASSIVVIGGIFVLLFVKCDGQSSVGIDLASQTFNKTFVGCNKDCNCQSTYYPTCGIDKVTYISPCYAGCKKVDSNVNLI